MTAEEKPEEVTEAIEFKAEIRQLLSILVHSLYTEREIFLRELLSNASDALNRVQFEMLTNHDLVDPDAELAVHISVDEEAKTITISDTGIGMNRDEIVVDLGTIAHSGAADFLRRLQQEQRPSLELIGQFGVGFYSVFMVAEEVRVLSRSYEPGAQAVEWRSDGGTSYHLGPGDKHDRGTTIEIKLKEDADEFASTWRLEQIIRKHSDFAAFPIFVGDAKEPANRRTALWRQAPRDVTEEQYSEFYRHMTLDTERPLLHSHLVADAPVDLRSILFVPSRRDRGPLSPRDDFGLRLYVHNVMIQEFNKDLLPGYLRFVEGVVESEDLPLNVSREVVQSGPAGHRIRRALTRKLIGELETVAEERPQDYDAFWREYGAFIKEGVAADPGAREDILPLLRFDSSKSGDLLVSLSEYAERMAPEQSDIYYVVGDDVRSVARSPHMDYFRANDIEVLYLVDPIDSFMMLSLSEFSERPFRSVDDAALDLPETEASSQAPAAIPEPDFNRLVGRCVQVLGERVLEVRESRILRDNPCRLVSSDEGPAAQMSRVYRLLDHDFEAPKRILELNRGHKIIANLAHLVSETPDAEVIDAAIEQLFENQLLVEGLHPDPTGMVRRIQELIEVATDRSPDQS